MFDINGKRNMVSFIFTIHVLFIVIHFISIYNALDECGSGINICETTIKMPWTKCYGYNCESLRHRYTLRCCGNMHKAECYKVCNITDEDLIIREHCTPRCVNGAIESGKCKCYNGYFGNCCDKCPDAKYCENGGTCSMVGSNETCYCRMGYHGDRCQHIDQTSSSRATTTTTKSMFTIKPTNITTNLTSTTPMTKSTNIVTTILGSTSSNIVTTILGSTSSNGSSRRRQTTHTKPFIKYQNTIMATTDTTQTLPKSFDTTKTNSPWRIVCISIGIVIAFVLMCVLIFFVCKRLKLMIGCAPIRDSSLKNAT